MPFPKGVLFLEELNISDVLSLCGIFYERDKTSFYIQCPCCDEKPYKKHLNVNLKKNVFRCPRCGVHGGVLDLYSLLANVNRENAYKSLCEKIKPQGECKTKRIILPKHEESEQEYPIIDVENRHVTYSKLLSCLTLSSDHRENLRNRGLTDEEIDKLGYKTTPLLGLNSIAKKIQAEGLYLSGVPGFYRQSNDEWTFASEKRGIMIPVRNCDGLIQGLQIRCDDVQKRKFRWVSSSEKRDGCKAEGWTHLAGSPSKDLIITEGPMKADVINNLTGQTVLAVPGVNSLSHLEESLLTLKNRGLQKVMTAFDMDYFTNYNVQSGFDSLQSILEKKDISYGTYLWDSRYKGLDDYIWEYLLQKTRHT